MNSAIIALGALIIFALGYAFYGSKIAKLFGVDPQRKTPAVERYDGVDYVPARHWLVLFGHHYSSIAGAGPIIGPVLAIAIWGWGPALLWIVLGTIFIGGIHDFGSLMASVRHGGSSVADIASDMISKKAKIVFSVFVWLALILVIAVFTTLCAKTLVSEPKIILPTFGLMPVAVLVGYLLYNRKLNVVGVTIFGLSLLLGLVFLGNLWPISFLKNPLAIWSLILIVYCIIASVVPVQILLQPRDYLSAYLLVAGTLCGYLGLFICRPKINLPMFTSFKTGEGFLWPMLFVTVACGAVSGFHSLIASGTTSKQLANERDAKKIGYGAMIAEGVVAILALLAIAAGLQNNGVFLESMKAGGPIAAYGCGFGTLTKKVLGGYGGLTAIMILNAFILTTLDTATRIGRYLTQELFGVKNRYLATFMVVTLSGWLALSGKWNLIWPVFGASNQLVAALALLVITCWLLSKGRAVCYTLIPAACMLITTLGALVYQACKFLKTKEYLLVGISVALIILALFVLQEVISVFRKRKFKNVS